MYGHEYMPFHMIQQYRFNHSVFNTKKKSPISRLVVTAVATAVIIAAISTTQPSRSLLLLLVPPSTRRLSSSVAVSKRHITRTFFSMSSLSSQPFATVSSSSTITTTTTTTPNTNMLPRRTQQVVANNSRRVVLHWFGLNDLRLHDNPALIHSTSLLATSMGTTSSHKSSNNSSTSQQQQQPPQPDVILPIFCFDTTTIFGSHNSTTSSSGDMKCSPRRAQFIVESVTDLRSQLQTKCHSELLIACGNPAKIFNELIAYIKTNWTTNIRIVCQTEVAAEEIQMIQSVRSVMKEHFPLSKDKLIVDVWGSTMYERNELPYDREALYHMPDGFTPFRTEMEKKCTIHKPLAIPKYLPFPHTEWPSTVTTATSSSSSSGGAASVSESNTPDPSTTATTIASTTYMPTIVDLGYSTEQMAGVQKGQDDPRGFSHIFIGGETAGLARIQQYIWDQNLLHQYFETRNGMIGADYSTKFSPWLAHGCISPRMIVAECQRYEQERVKNKSTYWVVFELLWRDYCKFFVLKHKKKVFYLNGITKQGNKKEEEQRKWNTYEPSLVAWKEGKTGYPLVDANMREMNATGFMSNRGRQNVASFLALDLQYDWRYGADYFESQLIDYDVYSNWVNWCAAAGMTGGRVNRFNIVKQSRDYDQHGEYVKLWIPELRNVPLQFVHEPWKMTQFQQIECNVQLGVDYPNPIIPPFAYNASGVPGGGRGGNNNNNRSGGGGGNGGHSQKRGERQRKPNYNSSGGGNGNGGAAKNRHQKYEMKGLKEGRYNYDDE